VKAKESAQPLASCADRTRAKVVNAAGNTPFHQGACVPSIVLP